MNAALVSWLMTPEAGDLPSLEEFVHRPAWHAEAACRGRGVGSFVLGKGGHPGPAFAVCDSCLVKETCLAVALDDPELVGVWGGTTTKQRERMRRVAG